MYTICESQEWLSDKEYLGLNLRGRLSVMPEVAYKVLVVAKGGIENT